MDSVNPPSFSSRELSTALEELEAFIKSYEILPPTQEMEQQGESWARIELMEEGSERVIVGVSERGWRLIDNQPNSATTNFATLDDLLSSISPQFISLRFSSLKKALKGLNMAGQEGSDSIERMLSRKESDGFSDEGSVGSAGSVGAR